MTEQHLCACVWCAFVYVYVGGIHEGAVYQCMCIVWVPDLAGEEAKQTREGSGE